MEPRIMSKNTVWAVAMLAAALVGSAPEAVHASDETLWQTCVGQATAPEQRVSACTKVIEAGTETGERLAGVYCNRGHGLTEQRQLDLALNDLDEALKLDPNYACAYNNRGRVYAFKRDRDRAMADYDQAIKLDPNFALAYNNRAMVRLDDSGGTEVVLADLTAAIKADPKLAIAYGNRGYIYYQLLLLPQAIADFDMQIKLSPDLLAYINRGNAFRESERLDRAAADYGEAIRLAPTDARGWRNRGMIRLWQGDNKGGVADYDIALRYDPADAFSWNNRGHAKLRLGDKKGAIADLRKALELQPGLQTARGALAKLGAAAN
jgi:tetratricopeptide (TPR) repeat protein